MYTSFVLQWTVSGRKCKHLMLFKRTLMHLFLFTNSAQRELVSMCTQSIHERNLLSLHYTLGLSKPRLKSKTFIRCWVKIFGIPSPIMLCRTRRLSFFKLILERNSEINYMIKRPDLNTKIKNLFDYSGQGDIEYKEGAIGFPYTLLWRFWTAEELDFA